LSAFNGLKFTQRGLNLQAKAQIGAELQYTRIGIGDGHYSGDIKQLNGLIHEVLSLPITSIRVKGNGQAIVGSALSNADLSVGFYLREIGIYATDPDDGEILYCYANAGVFAGYVPPAGGGDVVEKEVELVTTVGTASNVTASIDPSVYVTAGAVDARVAVVQEALDYHSDAYNVHGATVTADPERLMIRDPTGRAKVTDPLDADDIATKSYVDNSLPTSSSINVYERLVDSTSATIILTHTPSESGNYIVGVYFRVVTGSTNVSLILEYRDASGAQTTVLMPAQAFAIGSYSLPQAFFNHIGTYDINIKITTNVANRVYVSATVREA